MNSETQKHSDLALLLTGLVTLVCLVHLGLAAKGEGRFRDQHLGVALHYAATQIDLRHTLIPGFNANDTPTIQEVPVWQAAAGLAFKVFGTRWWGWGNVVSLILFLPCLYPLHQIARQFYGERAAWWTGCIFLCEGLVFNYAGEAGTDGFSLAVTIWFWFACVRLMDAPLKWFAPAVGLGVLAATAKLPFFMTAGLGAFFLVLQAHGLDWRKLAALAGVGGVAGILFLGWNHYTDRMQAGAEFPFVDLRIGGDTDGMSMTYWYFGDLHYRLNPANWIRGGWRFINYVFGGFALIALFVGGLGTRQTHPAAKLFIAGAVLTTLVFTHLVLHHAHYYLMFTPAVALLMAAAVTRAEAFLKQHGIRPALITGVTAAILLTGLLQGLMAEKMLSCDTFPQKMADIIRDHTSPQDKLMLINGGWGGEELMRTGRNGLSIWGVDIFDDAAKYARLKQLGYNRLVIISESPFQNAIQIINPGQTGLPREMARDALSPDPKRPELTKIRSTVKQWPTVVETDDIIIKEIP